MSLNQLPYNVILQVLWYVSPNKLDFGRFRKTCKRLGEITRNLRFGHLVTCGNCLHDNMNFDRISCLLLSQKGKNMTEIMLHYVKKCNPIKIDVLKFLVEHGADIHFKYEFVVKRAAVIGDLEAVKFLISCGANIHMQGIDCVMNNAATSGNLELVKYLIDQGACVNGPYNNTISFATQSGNLQLVKFLFSNRIDIHNCHDSIILWASMSGNTKLVKYFIHQGFSIDVYEGAPLATSVAKGDTHMSKFLISCGANINIDNARLIVHAAKTGNVEFIKYLIDQGINIHKHYNTALDEAVINKKEDMVEFLRSLKKNENEEINGISV